MLFDFDGTLTKKDSLPAFIRFACGFPRMLGGAILLSPMLLGYIFSLVKNAEAKRRVLSHFFKGRSRDWMEQKGRAFCAEVLPGMMQEETLRIFEKEIGSGAAVAVVSASVDAWLRPFCEKYTAVCICTELSYDASGLFTGHFHTPNCNGDEKPKRIRERLTLEQYTHIIAYGNSKSDLPMLAIAHEKHMLNRHG